MKRWRNVAAAVVTVMALSGCLGEEARFPEDEDVVNVPELTISDEPSREWEQYDYEAGELTGFSARLSAEDAAKHGLPRVLEFVGHDPGARTSAVVAKMSAYGGENLPIPDVFACFDQIEIRNEQQETILIVDNFCPADNDPHLRIIGDMSAGTPLAWIFESPEGTSRNNVDNFGDIGRDE